MMKKSRAQILRDQRRKRGLVHPVPQYPTNYEIESTPDTLANVEIEHLRYKPGSRRTNGLVRPISMPYRRGGRLVRSRHMRGCCEMVDSRYLKGDRVGKNKRLRGGGNPFKPPKRPPKPPVGQG